MHDSNSSDLIDWPVLSSARKQLGNDFIRILGYFQEDGTKAVAALEAGMRANSAVALVIPAHTLKGEAYQIGAHALGMLAERIENVGRRCIEMRTDPGELVPDVVRVRALFDSTMAAMNREINPLAQRNPVVRPAPQLRALGFGRA